MPGTAKCHRAQQLVLVRLTRIGTEELGELLAESYRLVGAEPERRWDRSRYASCRGLTRLRARRSSAFATSSANTLAMPARLSP